MAAFVWFDKFVLALGKAQVNLNSDALAIYLSDTAPNVVTGAVKADVPEIGLGNGYTGPVGIHNAYAQTGGVGSVTGDASETITASGGSVGPFRYVILYDSTPAGGVLIGYWDYGSELTLTDGTSFTVDLAPAILQLQEI